MTTTGIAVGIDLGSTYSCVDIMNSDRVEICINDYEKDTTHSWMSFTEDKILCGDRDMEQAFTNIENSVYDSKRLLCLRFSDREVSNDQAGWPFFIVHVEGLPAYEVEYQGKTTRFAPEQISAFILGKMKSVFDEIVQIKN